MPYSLILVDVENKLNIREFLQYKRSNIVNELEIIYCSSSETNCPNFRNYVFDKTENIEKILNAVVRKCSYQNIIIVRNIEQYKEVSRLIKHHKSSNQIIYLKQDLSKGGKFWYRVVQKTVGKMYSHNILPMDFGVVLYGQMASKVLLNVTSPSVLMRTNNWTGMEMIAIDGGGKYRFTYDKKKSALLTLTPLIVALLMLIIKLVAKLQMFQTVEVIYYSIIVLCLMFSVVFGCKWILTSILGENITDKAKILN